MPDITVIGDGGWGTAVALVLEGNGHEVTLWGNFPDYVDEMREKRENTRFLPGVPLPEGLKLTASIGDGAGAGLFVMAVPTQYIRGVFERIAPGLPEDLKIVSLAKGIENGTLLRGTEVVKEFLPGASVAMLSGPSHAEEVARGLPATVVVAAEDEDLAERFQDVLMNGMFRVYTSDDVVGVELAGALKNIIAVAAGICDGLGFGDNAKAALLSRGLVEMSRLGAALGGKRETFAGLAGVGDLFTTCASPFGRNRAVGERIGKGETLDEILASMQQVSEGVWTVKSAAGLAEKAGVEMPIAGEVHAVLFEGKKPLEAVGDLMGRSAKPEFW